MNALTLLGAPDLRDGTGQPIPAVLVQPKRLALLAYLTLGGRGRFHQRDTLLGLLWPDLDAEHARNGLNKAVHHLRAALGEQALVSRGERELRLDDASLTCDAVQFEQAALAARHAEAMALYQADLLPGFFLSGAPEFERWLEDTRTRLRRRAVTSALALSAEARAAGHPDLATPWARRALELAPSEEPAIRELVRALAQAGDQAGAVHTFERWAQRLHDELGVAPSAETLGLIEGLRRTSPVPQVPGATTRIAPAPTPPGQTIPAATAALPIPRIRLALVTGIALPIILAMVWASGTKPPSPPDRTASLPIAVLPFEVGGAPGAGVPGDGMVELLSTALRDGGGQPSLDPPLVRRAWAQAGDRGGGPDEGSRAVALSRRLGAGYVVSGTLVGLGADLVVTATMRRGEDGAVVAQARATGARDSLARLVEGLAGALLLQRSLGAAPRGTPPPLPAVRAYLDGRAAYRRGDYQAALSAYGRALDADSSFSEAAMAGVLAASVLPDDARLARMRRLAWTFQSGLGPVDRLVLRALAGPAYPVPPSGAERLARLDSAVTLSPDRADAWFMLGDVLYHEGPALGTPDAHPRSAAAFARALALDSAFEAPLEHLVDLATTAGDRPGARRLGERYLALHAGSERASYIRWRVAAALGDAATLDAVWRALDTMAAASLLRIAGVSHLDGIRLADGDAATAASLRRAATLTERRDRSVGAQIQALVLARNRGRLADADRLLQSLYLEQDTRSRWPSAHITTAMILGGPVSAADSEAGALHAWLDSAAATPSPRLLGRAEHLCIAGHWLHRRGDLAGAAEIASALDRALQDPALGRGEYQATLCRVALDAALASARHDATAPGRLRRLDSLAAARIPTASFASLANLEIARLFETAGDTPAALRAVRRRAYHWSTTGVFGLSAYLYQEGRLAAQTGDTAGAIAAYRHYLALRSDPDPAARAEADSARRALSALLPRR